MDIGSFLVLPFVMDNNIYIFKISYKVKNMKGYMEKLSEISEELTNMLSILNNHHESSNFYKPKNFINIAYLL